MAHRGSYSWKVYDYKLAVDLNVCLSGVGLYLINLIQIIRNLCMNFPGQLKIMIVGFVPV